MKVPRRALQRASNRADRRDNLRRRGHMMPKLRSPASLQPIHRFVISLIVLAGILVSGTTGYVMLGLEFLDALYQTVITISTVGFGDPENVSDHYRMFTIFLILFGTGTSLYTLGVVIEMLFDGRLDDQLRKRHMEHVIENLHDHIVVCGYGQVGNAIIEDVLRTGTKVVVIDRDLAISASDGEFLVHGDATDDKVLRKAGIEHARALVLALNSDVDNLYVALSARALREDLLIVARANHEASRPKLRQAGADRVVNPHQIGGAWMAAQALGKLDSDEPSEALPGRGFVPGVSH